MRVVAPCSARNRPVCRLRDNEMCSTQDSHQPSSATLRREDVEVHHGALVPQGTAQQRTHQCNDGSSNSNNSQQQPTATAATQLQENKHQTNYYHKTNGDANYSDNKSKWRETTNNKHQNMQIRGGGGGGGRCLGTVICMYLQSARPVLGVLVLPSPLLECCRHARRSPHDVQPHHAIRLVGKGSVDCLVRFQTAR